LLNVIEVEDEVSKMSVTEEDEEAIKSLLNELQGNPVRRGFIIEWLKEHFSGDFDDIWQHGFEQGEVTGFKKGLAEGKEQGIMQGVDLAADRIVDRADIPADVRRRVSEIVRGYY